MYIPPFAVVILLLLAVAFVVVSVLMSGIYKRIVKRHEKYQDVFSESNNASRVLLEQKILDKHFDLMCVLFIKEYRELVDMDKCSKLNVVTVQDLVSAWVDSKTGTLTIKNNRLTEELTKLVTGEIIEMFEKDNFKTNSQLPDDHAFDFDNHKGTVTYLSNNDFVKVMRKRLLDFNNGHKAFFS